MGKSHRHNKYMKIPKIVRQHWVCKTFWGKEKRRVGDRILECRRIWVIRRSLRESGRQAGVAGKSLLGNSETTGHRGCLDNRPLPEAPLSTILSSH